MRSAKRTFGSVFILIILCLLASCGDLFFGADGAYRVTAYVGGTLIQDGMLLSSDVSIQPVFLSDVGNDPDLTKMTVSIEPFTAYQPSHEVSYRLASSVNTASTESTLVYTADSFADDLPSFSIPEQLAPGLYTMVFQLFNQENLLQESVKTFYYLADAALEINTIQSWPPGNAISGSIPMVPPDTWIYVAADITSDPRLNPWLVWSLGNREIAAGFLSDDAQILMWKTPKDAGIFSLRLEVFPENPALPNHSLVQPFRNALPLACDPSAQMPGFSDSTDIYAGLYRFNGTLNAETNGRASLVFGKQLESRSWAPCGTVYGLRLDGSAQLLGADLSDFVHENALESFQIDLRLAAQSPGEMAYIEIAESEYRVLMYSLLATETGFTLRVLYDGQEQEVTLSAPLDESLDIGLEFTVDKELLSSRLVIVNTPIASAVLLTPFSGTVLNAPRLAIGALAPDATNPSEGHLSELLSEPQPTDSSVELTENTADSSFDSESSISLTSSEYTENSNTDVSFDTLESEFAADGRIDFPVTADATQEYTFYAYWLLDELAWRKIIPVQEKPVQE